MKKVTIVVPFYNMESFVGECLDSLITQTHHNIEILCVDDCSPDNSIDVVNAYAAKDERIKIVRHSENKGLGGARNTGIKYANGEYLCFVDSDDYVSEKFVELLYNAVNKNDSDIAVCNYWMDWNGSIKATKRNYDNDTLDISLDKQNVMEVMNMVNPACTNKIFRRSLIQDNELSQPEKRYYEGVVFWLNAIYYSSRISTIPDKLYYYRQRQGSIMKSYGITHIDDRFYYIRKLDIFVKDNILSQPDIDVHKVENETLLNILDHLHFGKFLLETRPVEDRDELGLYYNEQISKFSITNRWPGLATTYRLYEENKKHDAG